MWDDLCKSSPVISCRIVPFFSGSAEGAAGGSEKYERANDTRSTVAAMITAILVTRSKLLFRPLDTIKPLSLS